MQQGYIPPADRGGVPAAHYSYDTGLTTSITGPSNDGMLGGAADAAVSGVPHSGLLQPAAPPFDAGSTSAVIAGTVAMHHNNYQQQYQSWPQQQQQQQQQHYQPLQQRPPAPPPSQQQQQQQPPQPLQQPLAVPNQDMTGVQQVLGPGIVLVRENSSHDLLSPPSSHSNPDLPAENGRGQQWAQPPVSTLEPPMKSAPLQDPSASGQQARTIPQVPQQVPLSIASVKHDASEAVSCSAVASRPNSHDMGHGESAVPATLAASSPPVSAEAPQEAQQPVVHAPPVVEEEPMTAEQVACLNIILEIMGKQYSHKLKGFYAEGKSTGRRKGETLCLNKVLAKAYKREYESITDFASDLRKIAMTAYRKFGPSTEHAQNASIIEKILDQKVAMLSAALREKAALATTNALWQAQEGGKIAANGSGGRRSRRAAAPTPLIKVAEIEWDKQEKMLRKQREKEAKEREHKQSVDIMRFDQVYCTEEDMRQVQEMWEVPSMGVLLYLAQDALRLKHFSLTDLEIGLIQPQWSETLASVMVGVLLPFDVVVSNKNEHKCTREEHCKYEKWHALLVERLQSWYSYKQVCEDWYNAAQEQEADESGFVDIGTQPNIQDADVQRCLEDLGDTNPLDHHMFHSLPIFYRVRILYCLCSSTVNGAAADGVENWTRGREEGPLRMKLSEYENDELRGQILGEGSDKHTYFYCQQFAATDFRLYRQGTKAVKMQMKWAEPFRAAQSKKRASTESTASSRKQPAKKAKVFRVGARRSARGQTAALAAAETRGSGSPQQQEHEQEQSSPPSQELAQAASPSAPGSEGSGSKHNDAKCSGENGQGGNDAETAKPQTPEEAAFEAAKQALAAERTAAASWATEHCNPPDSREFFEIVCDELTTASATGELTRFGEFIDRIARSKGIKDKQLYERLSVVIEELGNPEWAMKRNRTAAKTRLIVAWRAAVTSEVGPAEIASPGDNISPGAQRGGRQRTSSVLLNGFLT